MAIHPTNEIEGYDPMDSDTETGSTSIVTMPVQIATGTEPGAIYQQAPALADLTAAPTMADFNTLLARLRTAGVIGT